MDSTRQIITDLRSWAGALEGHHLQGMMLDRLARSMERGAEELERLDAELFYHRAAAELPQEDV